MKDMIKDVLLELSHENISLDTETGRDYIASKLLMKFEKKHIVFYTNLEKYNAELKSNQMDLPFEKGL